MFSYPIHNPVMLYYTNISHLFKKSDILPVQYVPFEDTLLPIANNSHAFLCMAISPSYMVLPSVEKRFAKHIVDIELQ